MDSIRLQPCTSFQTTFPFSIFETLGVYGGNVPLRAST
jgi:hypothetical protein